MRIIVEELPDPDEQKLTAREQPNFGTEDLLKAFAAAYLRRTGSRVKFTRGKDYKLAAGLTESMSEEMLKQMISNFFANNRPNMSLGAFWGMREELQADAREDLKLKRKK